MSRRKPQTTAAPRTALFAFRRTDTNVVSNETEIAKLIAATAGGDRIAFEALYRSTSSKLLGVVLRIVRSRAEAEEILQEVYLRVWTNAGAFSPEAGSAFGWLVSIARNRAIDSIRARPTMQRVSADDEGDLIARIADPKDFEADIIGRDELAHCLGALPEPYRELIVLAYCHGASREELAERFDKPVSTIKTWLHRALPALKASLEAHRGQFAK